MSRTNLPPYRTAYRVMRVSGTTTTKVCQHRFERVAQWCAGRYDRRTGTGIRHYVYPAVTA